MIKSVKLSLETEIEMIAIRGDEVVKKVMTLGKALNIDKKKGWTYINYQIGFSSIKENKL